MWTGSPQWQIEGLRRLEIPEDMQKKYGFTPLGAADGPVKTAIFGDNNARLYNIDVRSAATGLEPRPLRGAEGTTTTKAAPARSNLRYGYVNPGTVPPETFA